MWDWCFERLLCIYVAVNFDLRTESTNTCHPSLSVFLFPAFNLINSFFLLIQDISLFYFISTSAISKSSLSVIIDYTESSFLVTKKIEALAKKEGCLNFFIKIKPLGKLFLHLTLDSEHYRNWIRGASLPYYKHTSR